LAQARRNGAHRAMKNQLIIDTPPGTVSFAAGYELLGIINCPQTKQSIQWHTSGPRPSQRGPADNSTWPNPWA
jgi:hypothetical protein